MCELVVVLVLFLDLVWFGSLGLVLVLVVTLVWWWVLVRGVEWFLYFGWLLRFVG